jgi:hypothetical protein
MSGSPIPSWLQRAVEAAIQTYPAGRLGTLAMRSGTAFGPPLCIKYIFPRYANAYLAPGAQVRISTTPSFTWGIGAYVTPLAFPFSSAIFGRVGVVSSFDPTGWRVFDATDTTNEDLYLQWLQRQRLARRAQLTMHTALYNHRMRNVFRTHFKIDCVLFHPDQHNYRYTDLRTDVWMIVADWDAFGGIRQDWSSRLINPKVSVLVEEEFVDDRGGRIYREMLGLTARRPSSPPTADEVAKAYHSGAILRIEA